MKKIAVLTLSVFCLVILTNVALAGEKKPEFKWTMQSVHPLSQRDFALTKAVGDRINTATNGRLKLNVVPNGTLASSSEGFQACAQGVFEMHNSWPILMKGIDKAFGPLCTGNFQMETRDKYMWIYQAGGWDLMQKALDNMNLKLLAVEIWGTEVMLANKPFKKVEEFNGKNFRTFDARLLKKIGINGISLPLEEVFTGMATGTVDMAEFANLGYDKAMGITDITKYGIWPDFWNVNITNVTVVNKDAWAKLPKDLQMIVELAFKANEFHHWTQSQWDSAVAYKELKESGKMQFSRLESEPFIELRKEMYKIEKEEIAGGGLLADVNVSFHDFLEVWYPYKKISAWWGEGLTAEEQLGFQPGSRNK